MSSSRLILLTLVACSTIPPAAPTNFHTLVNGDRIHYDGVFYDFRAADGVHQIKLWLPPQTRPIRGVFFHGNPGLWGDTRSIPRDERLQELAARHGFGIMGVSSFPARDVYAKSAKVIFGALDAWAALGHHPELAHVPLIARGSSNAGITAYSLTAYAPERMLCFTPNVGPVYIPATPSSEMLKVPAILHVGEKDPFFPDGVAETKRLMTHARARGARWSWIAEKGKAHEIGHIDDVDMAFYEACITARLPENADPRKGPITLRPVPESSGWLVDPTTWDDGLTVVAPYAQYQGDKKTAGWVLNETIAYLYRGVATYDAPVTVTLPDVDEVTNPDATGLYIKGLSGPIVTPGRKLTLTCTVNGLEDWDKVELFEGTNKLQTISKGQPCQTSFTVRSEATVHAFFALVHHKKMVRTSRPVHVLVRDPNLYPALLAQRKASRPSSKKAEQLGSSTTRTAPMPAPSQNIPRLVAYALTDKEEKTFAVDQAVSPFWRRGGGTSEVCLTPQNRASDETVPMSGPKDAQACVRATRSRTGLYLLFEVTDDAWSEVTPEYFDDVIDFHLAGRSPADIWNASAGEVFVKPKLFALILSGRQFQAWFGPLEKPHLQIAQNFADPWDTRRVTQTYAEAAEQGILIDRIDATSQKRFMEWRIPWALVTNGY